MTTESQPPPPEPVTDAERANWPTEVIVPLEAPFVDDRGAIQALVDTPMKSALMITARRGSIRANHFHHTDWHYCYVVSGALDYHHRPAGSQATATVVRVSAGQLFFTPPMEEHAMVFVEDTVFLTLGRNYRDQASYEADVERVTLVDHP